MRPFYRFTKLDDLCQCGSGHAYRACCFRGELIGFVIAMVLLATVLSFPTESWLSRSVRVIISVGTWICVFGLFRDWFVRKRARRPR
jgi:hypothetical protein